MKLNFFQWMPQSSTDQPNPPSLVFLHGMGGTGYIWRPIGAQLEDNFRCIAPDQRGHGLSRPVPLEEAHRFHALDYAQDVSELLDSLSIHRYFIIGHSMGARTALALAQLEPRKVLGLVSVDIGLSSQWGGGIGLPLATFLENLPPEFHDRATLKEYLFANCPDPSIAQYLSAVAKKTTENPETWTFPFDRASLVETIHQANEAPLETWLEQILNAGIRTTFLRGERSKVWLKEDYESQKQKFQHPFLEFQEWENCGHGLPFEQRARFTQFLRDLVKNGPIELA
ncbi:MAG: alpha/beta hydrolase fold protein [Chthonomonadaceae bacterium]|nr:alpha/beta hydrolase fold protein [Chthonomonadaceae bacterium]